MVGWHRQWQPNGLPAPIPQGDGRWQPLPLSFLRLKNSAKPGQ
jgi:hypothetical protein